MPQFAGTSSVYGKVANSTFSQGICLGCEFDPQFRGTYGRQLINVSLSLSPSLLSLKSISMSLGENEKRKKETNKQTFDVGLKSRYQYDPIIFNIHVRRYRNMDVAYAYKHTHVYDLAPCVRRPRNNDASLAMSTPTAQIVVSKYPFSNGRN